MTAQKEQAENKKEEGKNIFKKKHTKKKNGGRRCGAGVGQRPKVLGQSLLGKHTSARLKSKCWNTRLDVSILVGLTAKGQISLLLVDVRGGDTKTLGGLG